MGYVINSYRLQQDRGPFRLRSDRYMKHVRTFGCLVCGQHSEAHHLTFAQPRAMACKTGDQFTVPVCHAHHMQLHESPMPEKTWWALQGIDPLKWAVSTYEKWKGDDDG